MNKNASHGLTLIELMTVVAVLGIVLAMAAPAFMDLMAKRRVQAIATELSTDLANARSESGLRNYKIAVWFDQTPAMSCYTVSEWATTGGCTCTKTPSTACAVGQYREIKTLQIPAAIGVSITANSVITANKNRLTFVNPLHTPDVLGAELLIKHEQRGYQLKVQVNPMGRVSTCSPDGKISGVALCS